MFASEQVAFASVFASFGVLPGMTCRVWAILTTHSRLTKMIFLLKYFTARELRASTTGRPADLVACLAMTVDEHAAKRRPRNSSRRRIKLHKGSTELIILKCTIMEVAKMLYISRRSSLFRMIVGAHEPQLNRA